MSSKRSLIDSLNAGRTRKGRTSLEELNRSLENLESRIQRSYAPGRERGDMGRTEPDHRRRGVADTASRSRAVESEAQRAWPPASDAAYHSIARDIERVRSQEDGVASASRIAGELKSLREELRDQMTSGLHREFDTLRKEIAQAYTASPATKDSAELSAEFDRLSNAIQSLSGRSDDRGVNLLRLELEQVKAAVDSLAREETVQSVDRRWDEFDKRWSRFEDRYTADRERAADDPALAALNQRLEQINEAVTNLPDSVSLRSLEEKVRVLAGAVDHFANKQDQHGNETFGLLEERLDEISRAIVASTASLSAPHFDPEPFDRIEARITSLARQVEELTDDQPSVEVMERLNLLAQRVDEIAARGNVPEQAMERLAKQIAAIAQKIDTAPAAADADPILRGIEARFDALSEIFDRRQENAIETSQSLFRDLEKRLDEVAARLEDRQGAAMLDNSGIMETIDARFAELADRIDSRDPEAGDAIMRQMEARLENISAQIESSASQVAAIDPVLIKNLEAQVADLSAHLARPNTPLPDYEDIGPRLDEIEKSINGSRETILDAARQAAENAVKSFAGSTTDSAAVAGLADDLKSLETLTRGSDERNAKTFEAIHDTLLKIVDRLGTLEFGGAELSTNSDSETEAMRAPTDKMTFEKTPPLEPETPAFVADEPAGAAPQIAPQVSNTEPRTKPSPAQAAAAAAIAAMDTSTVEEEEAEEDGGRVRSMFGGLTRVFASKREKTEPALAGAPATDVADNAAPSVDLDEPLDPKFANRPLEPGSGAPDLNAIMKRVRDERDKQPARQNETEAAKSDFIAAARRAAQAAAAEAGTAKRNAENVGSKNSLGIGEFLRSRRKPILMGAVAIMLALAGLRLGNAFLTDDTQTANADPAPATSEQAVTEQATGEIATVPDTASPQMAAAGAVDEKIVRSVDEPNAVTDEEPAAMVPATDESADAPAAQDTAQEDDAQLATAAVTLPDDQDGSDADAAVPAFEAAPVDAGPIPLREAADAGDPKAMFEIGSRYAEGRGVKADLATASKWYEKSAELGFAPSQYRIGNFYEKGTGVARDIATAKKWYRLAADQGNASAMHNLAVLYATGGDDAPDNSNAVRWFLKAAELGVKDSQFNLGILFAKGVGVTQNLEEAYKWFALVAKAGDSDAADKRDEIANSLRPEQLQRARAATQLWKPKQVKAEANTVDIPEAWQESNTKTASIDMKKAIVTIQSILNKNGYDAGAADGVMGDKTQAAIVAFQKDNGLDPTGRIDEMLVKTLLDKK